ncbi:MAG: FixH family protein [Chlorobiales bacterium]|nr:FixH family protein [Chlorobiales bacterium]
MKIFLYGLYTVFLFAMVTGFYVAFRGFEGLVEDNYYEKAAGYFTTKKLEDSLNLKIVLPDTLKKGDNVVEVAVFMQGEPLRQAEVTFFVGDVSQSSNDAEYAMQEGPPGVYSADVSVPFSGTWLMRVGLSTSTVKTSRRWFTEIK